MYWIMSNIKLMIKYWSSNAASQEEIISISDNITLIYTKCENLSATYAVGIVITDPLKF